MGGFLVSVFVKSEDQAAVVAAAKETLGSRHDEDPMEKMQQMLRTMLPPGVELKLGDGVAPMLGGGKAEAPLFLVSPSRNGWVGVHDSQMQNQDEGLCLEVARELSERLNTTAITFLIHDGDFLCYWLAKDGKLLDEYNSMPDYFEEGPGGESGPSGGDAAALAEACGATDKTAALEALLSDPEDAYELLTALGEALGIVDPAVDYNALTYRPPKQIGFTVPAYEPKIADRDQYVTITKQDLSM